MKDFLCQLYSDEKGQGLTEYSLIISLVILGVIVVITNFRNELKSMFENDIVNKLP